jgi:hypothetical protein
MADYCTLWPDQALGKDWSLCCKAHDEAYQLAGSRLVADLDLARCVANETGWDGLAALMLAGVMAFGWIFRRAKNPD